MDYGKSSTGVDGFLPDSKTILIDVDGVLTDGRLTIDHRGEKPFKQFHTRDVRAIRELISVHGFEVVLVTADEWPGIHHFSRKVGAEVIMSRSKTNLPYQNFIAIGDDSWDVSMLSQAQRAFCPWDADESVKRVAGITRLETLGGHGVIAEMLREIIE